MGPGQLHNKLWQLAEDKSSLGINPVIIMDEAGTIQGSYMMVMGDPTSKDLKKNLSVSFAAKMCWTGKRNLFKPTNLI